MEESIRKVPEPGTDARKTYNLDAQNRHRAKVRQEKDLALQRTAASWGSEWDELHQEQQAILDRERVKFGTKVLAELGREPFILYVSEEDEPLARLIVPLFCLKKKSSPWLRNVVNPDGLVCGATFFADAIGKELIESGYRLGVDGRNLKGSPTFLAAYLELLKILHDGYTDRKFDKKDENFPVITAELAGEYEYKPAIVKQSKAFKKLLAKEEAEKVPDTIQILQEGREKLLDLLE